jgi:hypothetical protein
MMSAYVMYYFAGAVRSEIQLRSGTDHGEDGFLFSHHEPFRSRVKNCYDMLLGLGDDPARTPELEADLNRRVAQDIGDYNPTGFCDPAKHNLYPFA